MDYLALLLPVCLCWRARHLLAVTIAAALIIAAAGSRGGTASLVYLIPVLAVTFVLSYRLGDAGGWRRTIAGPALLAATAEVINPSFNPLFLMVTFGPWAAGEFVRSRRRLAAELTEAGELLEAERSRYADEAVRYERVHLARELHDTVAHWLTAVVIQARAGQVRSLTRQESMAATFADIMTAAARAGEEITRAATLLGRDGTSPDSLLELAGHLVDAVRATGTDVTFRRAGHHVPSPALAADALRIIQEGLTNAMKHAPGAPVSVTLEVTAAGLNVDIINGPARSAPLELDGCGGAGLLGMTERVKAHGGQLNTGPVPDGGWRIAASLPSGTPPGDTPLPLVAGSGSLRITACSVRDLALADGEPVEYGFDMLPPERCGRPAVTLADRARDGRAMQGSSISAVRIARTPHPVPSGGVSADQRHCVVRDRIELSTFRFSGGQLAQTGLPGPGWDPDEISPGFPAVLTGFEPATSTLTGWRALQAALQDLVPTTVADACPQRDSNPCRRLERAVS